MAQVAYPIGVARITELRLQRANPGDVNHEIPSTGKVETLKFGHGLWLGVITFGALDDVESAQRMEAFFASLDGAANTVNLPLSHIKRNPNAAAKRRNAFAAADVGTYWTHGGRLYIVTGVTGTTASMWPTVPLAANQMMTPAAHIVAREREGAPIMPHNPHVLGPWTWQFREAV